ncbi:helix-turn-helix transcriptional regulator [Bacillus sp. HC-Mk]
MAVSKIKVARVQLDLTQQQLAEKVGVTRQTISLIEKGKYNPSLDLCFTKSIKFSPYPNWCWLIHSEDISYCL